MRISLDGERPMDGGPFSTARSASPAAVVRRPEDDGATRRGLERKGGDAEAERPRGGDPYYWG